MQNMIGSPRRTVAPTDYPITLDDAKFECRLFTDDFDDQIRRIIWAATARVERDARHYFMTQTWQMVLDRFPCDAIELPRWPVQSLTFVKYYSSTVLTMMSSGLYQTDLISAPCRIMPGPGLYWPTADINTLNAVSIEWIAGYATKALVPVEAKEAILYVVSKMYRDEPLCDTYWMMISGLQRFGFTR